MGLVRGALIDNPEVPQAPPLRSPNVYPQRFSTLTPSKPQCATSNTRYSLFFCIAPCSLLTDHDHTAHTPPKLTEHPDRPTHRNLMPKNTQARLRTDTNLILNPTRRKHHSQLQLEQNLLINNNNVRKVFLLNFRDLEPRNGIMQIICFVVCYRQLNQFLMNRVHFGRKLLISSLVCVFATPIDR
ncbi:hypothetical protein Zmor_003325 [Zophobas morio]|uniref:Uncharacterized protein n=1 Tax=Zophobas morio TaxID=2755281 RepID=A0AA38HLQ8_9CUCU|nr:hypothetical protein Zmor_003325 [Zophobas morio]